MEVSHSRARGLRAKFKESDEAIFGRKSGTFERSAGALEFDKSGRGLIFHHFVGL